MRSVLAVACLLLASLAGCSSPDETAPTPEGNTDGESAAPAPEPSPDSPRDDPPNGTSAPPESEPEPTDDNETHKPPDPFRPHVLVGVRDTSINPYHLTFYRPNLTQHPCTYIQNFSCDVERLPLTVGTDDYATAVAKDQALWDAVEPYTWYWIPQTVFVAVSCQGLSEDDTVSVDRDSGCILAEQLSHGSYVTSAITTENPDALLAFTTSNSFHGIFDENGIPVDVISHSWGSAAPLPIPVVVDAPLRPMLVQSAGNKPTSSLLESGKARPDRIMVGGGYAQDRSEEAEASKHADVVSYYCRPAAAMDHTTAWKDVCGTSIAAPTVAGALSQVILALRQESGYAGSVQDGFVDPMLGITRADLRDALNRTASYEPEAEYPNTSSTGVPLNTLAPWLQWGWGFYDALVAEATIQHLMGQEAPEKSGEAQAYMEAQYTLRQTLYGGIL